jgi:hypothetical protein
MVAPRLLQRGQLRPRALSKKRPSGSNRGQPGTFFPGTQMSSTKRLDRIRKGQRLMKTLISAVLAVSLIVPVGAAQAQGHDHGGGGGHGSDGQWHGHGGSEWHGHGAPVWHGRSWGYHPGYRWSYYNGAWGWWPLAVLGGLAVGSALAAPYYAPPPAPYYAPPPATYYAPPPNPYPPPPYAAPPPPYGPPGY